MTDLGPAEALDARRPHSGATGPGPVGRIIGCNVCWRGFTPDIPAGAFDKKDTADLDARQAETRRILDDGSLMDEGTGEVTEPQPSAGEQALMDAEEPPKPKRGKPRSAASSF